MKTFVDGCEYTFEVYPFSNHDRVKVEDINGEMVASATVDHDVEQTFVTWYFEDGETQDGEYPFFEYDGDDLELVRWLVSVHPGNG
jgi:hypothetical protein